MRNQQGAALITVLMVIVVLLLLGFAVVQFNAVEATQVQRQKNQTQAHYLARSGIYVAIAYLEQQVTKYKTFDALDLVASLQGSLNGVGSYQVSFKKDTSNSTVKITAQGIVSGNPKTEETIVLDVLVEALPADIVYASTINWFQKNTGQLENTQKLMPSTKDKPLENPNSVILDAALKIMTDTKHYFKAPNMLFSERIGKELEIKNKTELHLYSNYIRFGTNVNMSGTLTLEFYDKYVEQNGKKYGVVYFAKDVFKNNENSKVNGITPGVYYLFENGTSWNDGALKSGGLIPALADDLKSLFDFNKPGKEGSLAVLRSSFVYSAGN